MQKSDAVGRQEDCVGFPISLPENAALSHALLIHPCQKVCIFWRGVIRKRIGSRGRGISQGARGFKILTTETSVISHFRVRAAEHSFHHRVICVRPVPSYPKSLWEETRRAGR